MQTLLINIYLLSNKNLYHNLFGKKLLLFLIYTPIGSRCPIVLSKGGKGKRTQIAEARSFERDREWTEVAVVFSRSRKIRSIIRWIVANILHC